jgi:Flp pilus assembly protein TadB
LNQLILCGIAIVAFALVMPRLLASSRRSRRLRGGSSALGDVLNGVFDPAKAAAIEQIRRKQEIGEQVRDDAGAEPGRPD